uniref:Uncharacterized protein n=1 Tax=Macrostomum lignano TaxID=282301 RepID=A0A1I8JRF3_9PLAT
MSLKLRFGSGGLHPDLLLLESGVTTPIDQEQIKQSSRSTSEAELGIKTLDNNRSTGSQTATEVFNQRTTTGPRMPFSSRRRNGHHIRLSWAHP